MIRVSNIVSLASLLPSNNQTIVSIGLNAKDIQRLSLIAAPIGTDRIVRPGNALNMDLYWDGYDVVTFLSKIITVIK